MIRFVFALAVLSMCGCASSKEAGWNGASTAEAVTLPNNGSGWLVSCGAALSECMNRSAALCPAGYSIVDANSQRGAVAIANPYWPMATVQQTNSYQAIIACQHAAE